MIVGFYEGKMRCMYPSIRKKQSAVRSISKHRPQCQHTMRANSVVLLPRIVLMMMMMMMMMMMTMMITMLFQRVQTRLKYGKADLFSSKTIIVQLGHLQKNR
jgi:chorismate synthase